METKATIRKAMLAKREAIAPNTKRKFEELIMDHIATLPIFQKSGVVSFYVPIRGEVDLLPLWHRVKKTVLFPKVCGDLLAFYPVHDPRDFVRGCFGILEPSSADEFDVSEVDLMIVPGIAFDHEGHRLGYGKGYYDRLINNNKGLMTVGVCFDEFYIERLPVEPWDANVNLVVTQTGVHRTEGEV
ncbi:MAG TPA: 5-formyltetrahydrofolate cyclo-ligase [Deltaproteobacteria bacterium]|nr:5-formyltetrahydrofolate cyclo-ligase [Deltaproteobacteria bacterium]